MSQRNTFLKISIKDIEDIYYQTVNWKFLGDCLIFYLDYEKLAVFQISFVKYVKDLRGMSNSNPKFLSPPTEVHFPISGEGRPMTNSNPLAKRQSRFLRPPPAPNLVGQDARAELRGFYNIQIHLCDQ